MNFWAGLDGQVYVRGNIYATDGVFNGTVYAKDGEFSGAIKAATLDGKLVGSANAEVDLSDVDYIDLGGMILDGRPGSTGIRFKPGYEPIKYQFAQAQSGPWHDTMVTNDKYRRDSLDGGTTWGTAYQFKGTDGRPGSDAEVTRRNIEQALQKASTISSSYIGVDSMGSPEIYGGKIYGAEMYAKEFNVYPLNNNDYTGSFNIHGLWNEKPYHMFQIAYYGDVDTPTIQLWSPNGGHIHLGANGKMLYFDGILDFYNVNEIRWGKHAPKAVFA